MKIWKGSMGRNISPVWRRLTYNRMSHFDRSFEWPGSLVLKRQIKLAARGQGSRGHPREVKSR